MRHLILASAMLASAAVAEPQISTMPVFDPAAGAPATCPPISRYEAARKGGKLGKSRLNELPAADFYKAVYRRIDGCVVPVIAGYGFGLTSRPPR